MTNTLQGKVAIVTGVSHDGQVGQAVAKALAAEGAACHLCPRKRMSMHALPSSGKMAHMCLGSRRP